MLWRQRDGCGWFATWAMILASAEAWPGGTHVHSWDCTLTKDMVFYTLDVTLATPRPGTQGPGDTGRQPAEQGGSTICLC